MGYKEEQRFRKWWLLLLFALIDILFTFGVINQVMFDKQLGDNPLSNTGLIITLLILLFFNLIFFSIKLTTTIDQAGISVKFFPIHSKPRLFSWDDISKAYLRKYNPLMEYGGWGIRFGLFGSSGAYNISGNMGLQLELSSGKKILIGTQNAVELEAYLSKVKRLKN